MERFLMLWIYSSSSWRLFLSSMAISDFLSLTKDLDVYLSLINWIRNWAVWSFNSFSSFFRYSSNFIKAFLLFSFHFFSCEIAIELFGWTPPSFLFSISFYRFSPSPPSMSLSVPSAKLFHSLLCLSAALLHSLCRYLKNLWTAANYLQSFGSSTIDLAFWTFGTRIGMFQTLI